MQDGKAIDARFTSVDQRFARVNEDIGEVKTRLVEVEKTTNGHGNNIVEHHSILERVEEQVEDISGSLMKLTKIAYVGTGIALVMSIIFTALVGYVFTKL